MLHWALTAAALLLLIFAIRTLFISSRGEDDGQQKLGCGFALIAALLWMYVLDHYLEDPKVAIRLGLGVLLVLPAIQALANPKGARILRAAVGLVLAVLIAGPPLAGLWNEYGPDQRSAAQRVVAEDIADLEQLREQLLQELEAFDQLRAEVRAKLQAGAKSWEELRADPDLMQSLGLLQRIDEQRLLLAADLAKVEQRLPELRAALERAEDAAQVPTSTTELDALRKSLGGLPSLDDLSIVQKHAQEKELEQFFKSEF